MKNFLKLLLGFGFSAVVLHAQATSANRIVRYASTSDVTCASAGDVGKVFVDYNLSSTASPLYVCANTGSGTYGWVQTVSTGTGFTGSISNTQVAVGSGTNTIGGSSALTFGNTLAVTGAVGSPAATFTDATNYTLSIQRIPGVSGAMISGNVGSALALGAANTAYIRILTTGSVGIGPGNTSPTGTVAFYDATGGTGDTVVKIRDGAAGSATLAFTTGGFTAHTALSAAAGVLKVGTGAAGSTAGTLQAAKLQNTQAYSAAGTPLPTCNGTTAGMHAYVSDATLPTYLAAYVSGGAVVAPVFCDGTNWVTN